MLFISDILLGFRDANWSFY